MPYHVDASAFRRGSDIAQELGIGEAELRERLTAGEFGPSYARIGGEYLLPAKNLSAVEFSFATDYVTAERHFSGPNAIPVASSEQLGGLAGEAIEVVLPGDQRRGSPPNCKAWLLGETLFFGSAPA